MSKKLDEVNFKIQSLKTRKDLQQHQEYDDYLIEKGQLENKINTHYKEKAIGACIRAKVKWIQEGESNSRFFLVAITDVFFKLLANNVLTSGRNNGRRPVGLSPLWPDIIL